MLIKKNWLLIIIVSNISCLYSVHNNTTPASVIINNQSYTGKWARLMLVIFMNDILDSIDTSEEDNGKKLFRLLYQKKF